MAEAGDRVTIVTKRGKEEGILIPSFEKNVVLLKLDNGYNVGFEKKEITKMTVLEKGKGKKLEGKAVAVRKELPTIAILHTGGTIASKADYRTGGVATAFSPEELLRMFPELEEIANIQSELVSQMWSDDLRFAHMGLIAKAIEKYVKKGVNGIIIGMGTDNLAVGAAALSFVVEKSPVPIILVGAQRSSDRGSSDAGMNLICAAEFVTKADFGGVAMCMHEQSDDKSCVILPACKTYKLHSSRRDAFKAVNDTPLARINYADRAITFLRKEYTRRADKLILKPKMEEKVGLLKIHVNMFPEQFEFFKGYKGLIIEGTGLGHTPGQVPNPECAIHKKMYPAIKKIIDSGCVVVMTTQCLYGGVNLNVYDKGRDLLALGVIPGKDMLGNTALVKLSWLLGNYKKEEVKKLMGENLRGEI
ncbi:MAG: Glu-tRNA(Gln) amidotransferase subunit GatD, partial [Nanoarchaeota archaeon]